MKHRIDENGQPAHVDIDPFLPTGICAICEGVPQETQAPEDRPDEAAPALE